MFYVVDNYTHSIEGEVSTRQEAREIQDDLEEIGIFIWSIVEASDREDLVRKIIGREGER